MILENFPPVAGTQAFLVEVLVARPGQYSTYTLSIQRGGSGWPSHRGPAQSVTIGT